MAQWQHLHAAGTGFDIHPDSNWPLGPSSCMLRAMNPFYTRAIGCAIPDQTATMNFSPSFNIRTLMEVTVRHNILNLGQMSLDFVFVTLVSQKKKGGATGERKRKERIKTGEGFRLLVPCVLREKSDPCNCSGLTFVLLTTLQQLHGPRKMKDLSSEKILKARPVDRGGSSPFVSQLDRELLRRGL